MRLQLSAMGLAATLITTLAFAGDNGHDAKHGGHRNGGSRAFCPHCGDACYPTVTKGTETKHCWNVQTKAICIPKVRFPWESSCCNKGCGKDGCVPPKCGRTKHVNVLIKHEYECSTCKYSWDVDSYKQSNGKSDKYDKASGVPLEAGPVEASLPPNNRRTAPATFGQSGTAAAVKKGYAEILTSFFK